MTVKKVTVDLTIPCILLTGLLACLKVGGVIGWSWWWVTLPLWLFPAIGLACMVLVTVVFLIILALYALGLTDSYNIKFTRKG